ncbi:hypothetical protein [uncultured Acinetobacter sp.]|uniref:hypothetical protein n=1 Tax=uncultured Acinetobacter sp. TaxID=165433 RepID=UPI0025890A17|nr:hypothetical protein [uncultured Acinetobacter sp.]
MSKINLNSENLIECLIKRKGGTDVPFGFNAAKQITYRFRPLDVNDPESPHIAEVSNEDHYSRFISIRESYRPYNSDNYEPVTQIPSADQDDEDEFDPVDGNDLLSVDLNTVSNDWLQNFAKDVLKLPPKTKDKLSTYAKTTYGLDLDHSMTANEMIRSIAVERKKEERNAHEAAQGE